jgi:hypothetical protein
MFDHEKLDVYQLELTFRGWATEFLVELTDTPSPDEDDEPAGGKHS